LFVIGAVGTAFCAGMFLVSCRVLVHFQSVEVIGDLLAGRLLAMIFLTFFSLLVFSHIITALSNLYLSNDLELCHSMPVQMEKLFMSRVVFTVMDSSWMLIIFGTPIFMAYAYVYRPGAGFYFTLLHLNLAMVIIAAGIAILVTMILVYVFPAQRTRDIIILLTVLMIAGLYLLFRFLRPERLVDPEAFFSLVHYLNALGAHQAAYLPTQWISETLWAMLTETHGNGEHLLEVLLTWTTAAAIMVIDVWVAQALYVKAFSKSQEGKKRRMGGKRILDFFIHYLTKPAGVQVAAVMGKDIRTFFRDNTQWSQLLLLGALVVVYVYNFSMLPLDRSPIRLDFLQNELAFLNMGLAGFVLSAVSARFVFPAISMEGEAHWIVQSSPLKPERYLWGKISLFLVPMLILGEVLIIVTNHFLQVTRGMMVLTSCTMFFSVFAIVSLGIGFGAVYPKFKHENIGQVSTGFGGVLYMIVCSLFVAAVIVLEAGPVYILFISHVRGSAVTFCQWAFILASFLAVVVLMVTAIFKPMSMGIKALRAYE